MGMATLAIKLPANTGMIANLVPVIRQLAVAQNGSLFLGPDLLRQLHGELQHVGRLNAQQGPAEELLLLSAMSEVSTLAFGIHMETVDGDLCWMTLCAAG